MSATVVTTSASLVSALASGQCVGIPTDTVYGIAARLQDVDAVASLFTLKGRTRDQPLAVLVASLDQAQLLGDFDERSRRVCGEFWPGALTVVVPRRALLDADLGGDPANIGLRVPDHGLVLEVIEAVGPLVATSANRSGEPTLLTAIEIAQEFGDAVGAVFDGGILADGASTVVDLTSTPLRVLREGPISAAALDGVA